MPDGGRSRGPLCVQHVGIGRKYTGLKLLPSFSGSHRRKITRGHPFFYADPAAGSAVAVETGAPVANVVNLSMNFTREICLCDGARGPAVSMCI